MNYEKLFKFLTEAKPEIKSTTLVTLKIKPNTSL